MEKYPQEIDLEQKPPNGTEEKLLPNKIKYLTAAAIFYGYVVLGFVSTCLGPTLTSLQQKYSVDDATISRVFTILTCGGLVGALAAGFIYNHVNRQLCVIILTTLMSLIIILTPHIPTLTIFFISAGILGVCISGYATAQFVWILEMMQKECPPYVQSAHFFFGVGTNLGSWLMAVCLKDEEDSTNKLILPYTIVGILVGMAATYQIILFIFLRYYPPPPEQIRTAEETNDSSKTWSFPKIRMVVLCAIYYGFYQGMEQCTFQFFPKFGQNSDLHLSESDSALVLTGMTAAFTLGRAAAIIFVFRISTHVILSANILMVAAANVVLIMWASINVTSLWVSSILFGAGFSSMYGSFAAYMQRYLNFTNNVGSIMVLSGSVVIGTYPLIVGSWIEEKVIVLSYVNFFSLALVMLAVGSLSYLTNKNKTRY